MKHGIILVVLALVVGLLTWVFPLFRIIPLEQVAAARSAAAFDAKLFAKEFWEKQLVPSFEQATEASELIAEIKTDPNAAIKRFGRSVGIGRVYLYFLRGEGRVVAIEKTGVSISCIAPDEQSDLILKTGLLFGNTIRDATGQLLASEFPNSQDFNAISKELNSMVEKQIQPVLVKHAKVGAKIRFVGCAEVRASTRKLLPLMVIPLSVEFPDE